MSHAEFALQEELKKLESNLRLQSSMLSRQTSLQELVRAMRPKIPSHLRAVAHNLPALKELRLKAEKQAEQIVKWHLEEIDALSGQKALGMLDQRWANDWIHLRGNFPALAHMANRERLQRRSALLSRLEDQNTQVNTRTFTRRHSMGE